MGRYYEWRLTLAICALLPPMALAAVALGKSATLEVPPLCGAEV